MQRALQHCQNDRPLFSLPRELCPLSLDESRVEIVRGWVTAQQAVQVEAASRRAGSCWLERPVREVIRGEVERLEREHPDVLWSTGVLCGDQEDRVE